MLTQHENDLLSRVEGEAPMGQIMRRHWLPACMSEEVAEPDGAPVRTRLARRGPRRLPRHAGPARHARTSIARTAARRSRSGATRNAACAASITAGRFDVDGNILDMASEPEGSRLISGLKHKSYPVREGGGFVWVYMGPRETMREFEPPAWAPTPTTRISIVKMHTACNWAQVLEGSIDSAHSSSLHSSNMPAMAIDGAKATGTAGRGPRPTRRRGIQVQQTDFGFRYAAIRRPIVNAETHDYIRTTLFIAPFTVLIPPNDQYNLAQMLVPIDDLNTMFYWVAWHETKGIDQEAWRKFCGAQVGDRSRPRLPQDAHPRQPLPPGPRRDEARRFHRHRRHPGAGHGDVGIDGRRSSTAPRIISARATSRWRNSAARWSRRRSASRAAGRRSAPSEPRIPHVKLASFEGMVPKKTDWRTLAVSSEELEARTKAPAA